MNKKEFDKHFDGLCYNLDIAFALVHSEKKQNTYTKDDCLNLLNWAVKDQAPVGFFKSVTYFVCVKSIEDFFKGWLDQEAFEESSQVEKDLLDLRLLELVWSILREFKNIYTEPMFTISCRLYFFSARADLFALLDVRNDVLKYQNKPHIDELVKVIKTSLEVNQQELQR
jgi:hypothetical protein